LSFSVLRLTVQTVQLNADRVQEAASDSFMGATDLADYLVGKGVPFRHAHEIVARAVRQALSEGKTLSEMDLASFSGEFADLPRDYLRPANIVARKDASFTRPAGMS
jgi:argininosuccinate lyase